MVCDSNTRQHLYYLLPARVPFDFCDDLHRDLACDLWVQFIYTVFCDDQVGNGICIWIFTHLALGLVHHSWFSFSHLKSRFTSLRRRALLENFNALLCRDQLAPARNFEILLMMGFWWLYLDKQIAPKVSGYLDRIVKILRCLLFSFKGFHSLHMLRKLKLIEAILGVRDLLVAFGTG